MSNPFHIPDVATYKSHALREAEALSVVKADIETLLKNKVPHSAVLVGPDGKPTRDYMNECLIQIEDLFTAFLAMPSLCELTTTPAMAETQFTGSYAVAFMFYSELSRLFRAAFPEFGPHITRITLLTLSELADPKEPTLLDAFLKHFKLTIKDSKTDMVILGDTAVAHQTQRLRSLVEHVMMFLASKKAVDRVDPEKVQLTPKGLRLLEHLRSMAMYVQAMQEAYVRLDIKNAPAEV